MTGGASGIGAALVRRLAAEGAQVVSVDIDPGGGGIRADVSRPEDWAERVVPALHRLDIACLNAGVVTGEDGVGEISLDAYRRVLGVNVDGVVFGVRALLPLLERDGGGDVLATASLAALVPVASDPLYTGTKHFVVGYVRSAAEPLRERGVRINALCPGIADTSILSPESRVRLEESGFPLLSPDEVADAAMAALQSGETGQAWVCQPGLDPQPYRFRGVPGPRVAGAEGVRPPL